MGHNIANQKQTNKTNKCIGIGNSIAITRGKEGWGKLCVDDKGCQKCGAGRTEGFGW